MNKRSKHQNKYSKKEWDDINNAFEEVWLEIAGTAKWNEVISNLDPKVLGSKAWFKEQMRDMFFAAVSSHYINRVVHDRISLLMQQKYW